MREIIRFIFRCVLFLIPIGLVIGGGMAGLYLSGEAKAVDQVIHVQQKEDKPALFGLAYSYPVKYYKLNSYKQSGAKVLALGSSRVMQFRGQFIKEPENFYNAGGAVNKIRFFNLYFSQLQEEEYPDVLILGIDQWWFNKRWDDLKNKQFEEDLLYPGNRYKILLTNFPNFYQDLVKGKVILSKLYGQYDEAVRFGLSARMQNHGFRNDGSYYYGNYNYNETLDKHMADVMKQLHTGTGWFIPSDTINYEAVAELESFLLLCKENDIQLVAFLPPVAYPVYEEMVAGYQDEYPNFFELYQHLKPVFEKYNYPLYDYLNPASFGATANEAIDGTHLSEKAYLKLYMQLLRNEPVLQALSDSASLQQQLINTPGNIEVYGNSWNLQ